MKGVYDKVFIIIIKMKFSIIVPVYNVEKYISKCLDSIENQTFRDFEAIIINDGTKDDSQKIIDKYVKRCPTIFKSYIKENGGLSDARNYGIDRASGEYIIFVDSDDWIDIDLLEKLNSKIEEHSNITIIRIPKKTINEEGNEIDKEIQKEDVLSGEEAFILLRRKHICIETSWSYCINKDFWINNNYKFPKEKLHEDFAIMLTVVLKAEKIAFITDSYYNYLVRENSIITNKNYKNELKKALHVLEHYDNICKELQNMENISFKTKEICMEYISTAVCNKINNLKRKEKKDYQKNLKKRNILKNIKVNSIRNLVKKIIFIVMLNI